MGVGLGVGPGRRVRPVGVGGSLGIGASGGAGAGGSGGEPSGGLARGGVAGPTRGSGEAKTVGAGAGAGGAQGGAQVGAHGRLGVRGGFEGAFYVDDEAFGEEVRGALGRCLEWHGFAVSGFAGRDSYTHFVTRDRVKRMLQAGVNAMVGVGAAAPGAGTGAQAQGQLPQGQITQGLHHQGQEPQGKGRVRGMSLSLSRGAAGGSRGLSLGGGGGVDAGGLAGGAHGAVPGTSAVHASLWGKRVLRVDDLQRFLPAEEIRLCLERRWVAPGPGVSAGGEARPATAGGFAGGMGMGIGVGIGMGMKMGKGLGGGVGALGGGDSHLPHHRGGSARVGRGGSVGLAGAAVSAEAEAEAKWRQMEAKGLQGVMVEDTMGLHKFELHTFEADNGGGGAGGGGGGGGAKDAAAGGKLFRPALQLQYPAQRPVSFRRKVYGPFHPDWRFSSGTPRPVQGLDSSEEGEGAGGAGRRGRFGGKGGDKGTGRGSGRAASARAKPDPKMMSFHALHKGSERRRCRVCENEAFQTLDEHVAKDSHAKRVAAMGKPLEKREASWRAVREHEEESFKACEDLMRVVEEKSRAVLESGTCDCGDLLAKFTAEIPLHSWVRELFGTRMQWSNVLPAQGRAAAAAEVAADISPVSLPVSRKRQCRELLVADGESPRE